MLTVDGIDISVSKKRIRNIYLRVRPDLSVTVSAPLYVSNREIERFVRERMDWIRTRIAVFGARPKPAEKKYTDGETIYVWGVRHTLRIRHGRGNSAVLSDGEVLLTVREGNTYEQTERYMREWYRRLLKEEIPRILPGLEDMTGLTASGWHTRYMTSRWGTCNTRTGEICINVQLAERPKECVEYVILHELLHLAERTHNAQFTRLMDAYMPSWRKIKDALNRPQDIPE